MVFARYDGLFKNYYFILIFKGNKVVVYILDLVKVELIFIPSTSYQVLLQEHHV